MKSFSITIIIICLNVLGFGQTNLNLITASMTSSGNIATVGFTPTSALPSGQFIGAINIFVKTPQADFTTTTVNISSSYSLNLISNWEEGADHWWYYQGQPSTPTSSWSVGVTQTIATFTVSGTNLITLQNYDSGPTRTFWPGPAATIGDDNLVSWPVIQATPLPITIKSFSATKDGERSSRLDWTSSSEINSDYIGIERSTDGEDWTTVGHVKAAGNSNRDIDYVYYDRSLPMVRSIDNIFYYRLRLTDLDGQYKYSETRGVNMGRLEGLVSIYPNPATDIINVDLTDMDLHEGIIHLSVYDNTGKAIITKEVNGAGIEPIQASNMAAGSYQVVVKQGDTTHRKQIIVVN